MNSVRPLPAAESISGSFLHSRRRVKFEHDENESTRSPSQFSRCEAYALFGYVPSPQSRRACRIDLATNGCVLEATIHADPMPPGDRQSGASLRMGG